MHESLMSSCHAPSMSKRCRSNPDPQQAKNLVVTAYRVHHCWLRPHWTEPSPGFGSEDWDDFQKKKKCQISEYQLFTGSNPPMELKSSLNQASQFC